MISENELEYSNKIKLECEDSIFRMCNLKHVMNNINDLRDNNEG